MQSFLQFVPLSHASVATASLDVWIARTGESIGTIAWHPAWRQYAFTPQPSRQYTRLALRLIATKCERLGRQWLMRKRKADPAFTPKRGAPIPKPVKYARPGRPAVEREL